MRLLFVSLSDDIGTDRLVSEMARAGGDCAVLGPRGCVASLPRGVSARFAIPGGLRSAFALSRAIRRIVAAWAPDRMVPLDDLASTLLRSLVFHPRLPASVRELCVASFGAPEGYQAACGRVRLMEMADAVGVRIPAFTSATGRADLRPASDLPFPVMVKRDQSSGSGGVVRVLDKTHLASVIRRGWLKSAAKAQVARLAGLTRDVTPVLIQGVVEGRLAMFTAVCRTGTLIDGAGFTAIESHSVKGSSTILRFAPHPEMEEAARRLVAALGCSGFVSFDFIIDDAGRAFLIEMNPRPIGSAHLGRRFGHDLVRAFLTGKAHRSTTPGSAVDIALFPKELERDPTGSRLVEPQTEHDLPVHEPAVVTAYLKRLLDEHPAHAASLARHCGMPDRASAVEPSFGTNPEACENPV